MWHYATVVFGDNTIYSLGGTRETEGEAIAAEASFRLLASPEVPQTPDYSDAPQSTSPQIPSGAINWTEAGQHIGETVTVYGTVAGSTYASTSNGQPTFINIGVDYPDTSRVSVVIWGEDRGNFPKAPESMYLGKTICVTGEVYIYSGACNIKVQSSSQIQVME
jgi:DNA/RNA endonuclease YhcR with UshA esterase domain